MRPDATSPRSSWARRHADGIGLIVLAAVLMAACCVGVLADTAGYVWPGRLLNHPIIFGAAAGLLGVLSAVRLFRGLLCAIAIVMCLSATAIWGAWFALMAAFSPSAWAGGPDVSNQAGTLRARVFLAGIVDPIYLIRIEQTDRGPLNRALVSGCINGDALVLQELRWQGSSLIADTSAGAIAITVATDGRAAGWHSIADDTRDEGASGRVRLEEC
jgi:hypothetical protein